MDTTIELPESVWAHVLPNLPNLPTGLLHSKALAAAWEGAKYVWAARHRPEALVDTFAAEGNASAGAAVVPC